VRPYTPLHGPHKGQPGWRHANGTFEVSAAVDSAHTAPSVVLPPEYGRDLADDRETVDRQTGQMVRMGLTPDSAREAAITAARRNLHGQSGRPYLSRS
jgi:hypothetical protein